MSFALQYLREGTSKSSLAATWGCIPNSQSLICVAVTNSWRGSHTVPVRGSLLGSLAACDGNDEGKLCYVMYRCSGSSCTGTGMCDGW
jgi:hypothetical protein